MTEFQPKEHLMQIKNRGGSSDYLPVQWRLVWFNEQCPEGKITIVDKIIEPDREVEKEVMQWNNETRRSEKVVKRARGWASFHVRVEDGKGKVGEAVKSESAVDFDDYIEKADTGATGRALAKIGYGTQFAPDFDEAARIVDAPVEQASNGHVQQSQQSSNLTALERVIEQVKREFEEMYPDFVRGQPDTWFTTFQTTVLGAVPAQLSSTDVAKMRSYLADKRKSKPARAS